MKIIQHNELYDLTLLDGGKFKVTNLRDAYSFCEKIATSHYENFPVGSILIPKHLRSYFYSVYAFARIADDIADECKNDINNRLNALDNLNVLVSDNNISTKDIGNPILLAVLDTMNVKNIPNEPFQRLLIAFKQDILFTQINSFKDLEEYSSYSANPIGELVLRIFDNYNDETIYFSNKICTALQLINFWQDLSRDLLENRCYLPKDILNKHNLTKENLQEKENSTNLINCLSEIYKYTSLLMLEGKKLTGKLNSYRFKLEIKATIAGGEMILKRTEELKEKIIFNRPRLSKIDFWSIVIKSLI